ncbi:helix-turn-helix domain-containing protein [Streptomyces sp. NPDC008086]|uniref:helix-turn-helix domain-containing protein n=1 Tax=Streptomyces sp. NPDC008086 TaxID=3364807 RepID=UPI0036E2E33C
MTTPSPERARLAAALRELKGRTGLSLAALAAKTAFSKSSWDRYLNARTVPPRDAVQELCRLAGEPEGRCVALWEIAESQGSGRATEEAPAPPEGPPPGGDAADDGSVRRSATLVAVLASVCAVAVGGLAAVALLLPHRDAEPRASLSPAPATTGPRCQGEACEGKSAMQMKCAAGPQTLAAHRTASGAWMELRYSRECGTSWARMWSTHIGDRLEMSVGDKGGGPGADGVRSAEIENDVDADNYVYTPMTAARPGTVVRACLHPAAGGGTECFDSRVGR